jgi:hypothetical protein
VVHPTSRGVFFASLSLNSIYIARNDYISTEPRGQLIKAPALYVEVRGSNLGQLPCPCLSQLSIH